MTYEYVMVHSQFRGNDSDDIKSKNWSAPVMLFAHSVAKVMAVCLYSNIAISEVTLQNGCCKEKCRKWWTVPSEML